MMLKTRLRASLVHAAISALVLAGLFVFAGLTWFPFGLFVVGGGAEGSTILLLVDVVLGPALTFIIYNTVKTRSQLVRDISIIALVQVACLIAGACTIYNSRPVAVVHLYDTFYVLREADYKEYDLDVQGLKDLPGGYPKVVFVPVEGDAAQFFIGSVLRGLNDNLPRYLNIAEYKPLLEAPYEEVFGSGALAENGRVLRDVMSVYASGSIHFDVNTLTFSGYRDGESVSELKGATATIEPNL
ncbi:hypothetical protein [Saccharophagus degradans]|uniref:Type IV pilin accessory protein n=1 Tax=Saccharophagus degradans TaxID=86304 RepID=A0AAW7X9U3_9GAMM|nr:hypothetical protein [Saccharophagus degradans]MDO6423222.1 hypothetical protein [Saccharophagus degradans]MDO6607254.1 hypothetical protein [Saccharophagus degradans]